MRSNRDHIYSKGNCGLLWIRCESLERRKQVFCKTCLRRVIAEKVDVEVPFFNLWFYHDPIVNVFMHANF